MSLKENFDPNLVTQPMWEPTIMHQNFSFHKKEAKYSIKFGWTCYYRCSKFRHPCSAVIMHRHAAGIFEIANGIHTCAIGLVEKRKLDPVFINTTGIMDLTAEINIKIELLALTDMQPARLLAIQISEEFELLYAGQVIKSLSRDQIRKKIKRFRLEEFGNWQSVIISSPPLCLATDTDESIFLQFNMSINIDEEMVRFVGWANPNLIFMAQCLDTANIFIDCTFYIVPKGFSQCLIIMVFHPVTKLYLPVFLYCCKGRNMKFIFMQMELPLVSVTFVYRENRLLWILSRV